MASRGLGTLTLDLVARIAGFEGPMDKAARTTAKRMGEIEKSVSGGIKSVLKSFAAFGAGFLSVQAVFQGFSSAIDQADKLNDFTKRLGVSAEAISAWGYAASQTGTDIDGLGKGLKLLQKNMAEALDPKSTQAGLFKSLGISVKDAQGNLRDLESILPEIADKFKTLDNDATETALSMQLFGKSGSDLREFLDLGSEGLDAFTEKARDLGIVLSQETLSAADDFNDAIGDLKTATQGAIYQALEPLLPVLQSLIVEMVKFAKSGDGAKQAGEEAASGITSIGTAAKSVYGFLTGLREGLAAFEQQARGYTTLVLGGGATSLAQIEQSAKRLNAVFDGTFNASKAGTGVADPISARLKTNLKSLDQQAKDIAEATKKRDALQAAVNGYLGNPTGKSGTGSKKKEGKSEAEKDAERLQKAYESMNERLKEQAALFGVTGEAAKLRYEIESGALKGLDQAKAAELIAGAELIDQLNAEADVKKVLDDLTKEREDATNRGIEATAEQIDQMEFELGLIGLGNKERARQIELRYADAAATDEQRQKIAELSDQVYEAEKSADFFNDTWSSIGDAFVDVGTRSKTALEAIGDVLDDLYKRALQFVADQAIQALIGGATGGAGGGASAGSIFDLFSGAFGFANGGQTLPNSISEVNERGFEMASVGGRDYLLTGNKSVKITPHERLRSGGGINLSNTFLLAAPTSQRTQEQVAQRTGYEVQMAQRRNG